MPCRHRSFRLPPDPALPRAPSWVLPGHTGHTSRAVVSQQILLAMPPTTRVLIPRTRRISSRSVPRNGSIRGFTIIMSVDLIIRSRWNSTKGDPLGKKYFFFGSSRGSVCPVRAPFDCCMNHQNSGHPAHPCDFVNVFHNLRSVGWCHPSPFDEAVLHIHIYQRDFCGGGHV